MHAAVLLLLFSTIMSSIYEKVMNDLHLGAKFFFPLAEVSIEVESLFSGNVSDHDRAATQPSKVKNITILVLKHD